MMGEQQGTQQGTEQGKDTKQPTMTAAEVQELIRKESDRLDLKYKGASEKLIADAKAQTRAEIEAEKKTAEMSEVQRLEAELKAVNERVTTAESQRAASEAAATRAQFVANNAADFDLAWRVYLDQQLAAASDGDKPEDVLARVRAEREQEQTGKATALGVAGRPGQGAAAKGRTMNDMIREAAGRK